MRKKSKFKQKKRARNGNESSPADDSVIDLTEDHSNNASRQSTPAPAEPAIDQAISHEEDFISLDIGGGFGDDSSNVDSRQSRRAKERAHQKQMQRKRKHSEIDSGDESDVNDTEAFPWLILMPEIMSKPLNTDKLFDLEVRSIVRYLEPSKGEKLLRDFLVYRIRRVIEDKFPGSELEVFGSFATDMYLPNSDIDMVVQGSGVNLKFIGRALEKAGIANNMQMILHAQVPVIKFEDTLTNIKVDVIQDSDSGVESAECIRSMAEKQPALRPLSLLVKHFLMLKGLNEVYTGGMGGYAVVCMVMSFLQMHPKVAKGQIDPLQNLATLLIEFFQLYGICFNIENVGICVKGKGRYFEKRNVLSRQGRPVFTIRDPMDASNDIGMKSYNATMVMRQFRYAYLSMTSKVFELAEGRYQHNRYHPQTDVRLSILARAFTIPTDMMQLRAHIDRVYRTRTWEQDPDAQSFLSDSSPAHGSS